MKVKISGASGYLGRILTRKLRSGGHTTEGIDRTLLYGPVDQLAAELHGAGAVIHLAGSPLLTRWTEKTKKEIIDSRAVTGHNIAMAINSLPEQSRPAKVISASGASIYAPGRTHTEDSPDYGNSFPAKVVKKWEQAWKDLSTETELTIFRMAVVLGMESATIKTMLLPYRMGLGGKVGSGKQFFPFVHEEDVARAYIWALETPRSGGTFILAAPAQIDNATFSKALARAIGKPAFLKIPPFALKLLYGEASQLLTESPAVQPAKLIKKNFHFKYPTIEETLNAIFKK